MPEISGMIQEYLEGQIKTIDKTPVIQSKSITENGTYTAPEGVDGYSPVIVDVPLPQNAYLLKSVNTPTPIASFSDGEEMPMPSLKVAIEPQQDLHGYDVPWVGGAGKNKLQVTATTQTVKGITYTVNDDGTIKASGTPQEQANILVGYISLKVGTYIISGVPSAPSFQTFQMYIIANGNKYANLDGTQFIVSEDGQFPVYITVYGALSQPIEFKPMIRLASVQDATFAPYSNICPISGWDEVDVTVADDVENPTVSNVYTIDLDGTRYGGEVDVVNGIFTPAPYYASYNGETLTGEWISDRDKYEVGATPTIGAQVVNIGASGTPVSILPTAIKSLRGVNNVYANTGDITDAEYFSKEG